MRTPPQPPKPPNPTRSLRPHLRLSCDEAAVPDHGVSAAAPASYKFPAPAIPARKTFSPLQRSTRPARLVAAKVDRAPVERRFTGSDSPCALVHDLNHDDPDRAGRITSSRELVREIESTLDRMQSRLTRFRSHMDEAFKFPMPVDNGDDDSRPRAA